MSTFRASLPIASAGCYDARRAAVLSGVPKRTVYDWARKKVVVPGISPEQEKLWSYADLMALRIVSWLRQPKSESSSGRLPASLMSQVREALTQLDRMNLNIWSGSEPDSSRLVVDQRGDIFIHTSAGFVDLRGNNALPHEQRFGLLGPFQTRGQQGPDLVRPRPHLRIVPERVAGEPHVENTRLTTRTLAGLASRGFTVGRIAAMYDVTEIVVDEAVELEEQLSAA